MAEEDEVAIELEAVQAVYGDDCVVLRRFPPHLIVYIKPRTADVSSQQFVEASLEIQAGPQYPMEPPLICITECKGLDEERKNHLISSIQVKALELASCLMLVALCEEAVERLSIMNHPDGNCPLCLYPLVMGVNQDNKMAFMKLMSCFHCFHSECIIRWWNWLQADKGVILSNSTTEHAPVNSGELKYSGDMSGIIEESMGTCPVCRKAFHAKDIVHVLDLVGALSSQMNAWAPEDNNEELLQSDAEIVRKQKFEALLKLQQENSGLIEPKRNEVLRPGMFLLQSNSSPAVILTEQASEQHGDPTVDSVTNVCSSSNTSSSGEHRKSGMRKYRVRNSKKPVKQWIKKENGTAG